MVVYIHWLLVVVFVVAERETDSKNRLKCGGEKMPRECCLVTFRVSYHKKIFVSNTNLP